MKRAIIVVIDSMGIGAMPDSLEFGDDSTVNTLCNLAEKNGGINLPNFEKLLKYFYVIEETVVSLQ